MRTKAKQRKTNGHAHFPTPNEFLRMWSEAHPRPVGNAENIERFIEQGAFDIPPPYPELPPGRFDGLACISELRLCAEDATYTAVQKALSADSKWFADWPKAIAYARKSYQLNFLVHAAASASFKAHRRPEPLRLMPFYDVVWVMVNCWLLGWREAGRDLYDSTIHGLEANFFIDSSEYGRRRAQYFCLRLLSDWLGETESRVWPAFAVDEPIFETILELWRDPDSARIEPALVATFDRHMRHARYDSDREFYDFQSYSQMYQPYEVLLVFRLREWVGLSNPMIDHPLTATPLGVLPPEVDDYSDHILGRMLNAAKTDCERV